MRRTDPQGHGPVRYGPPLPGDGLPVLPELAVVLAAAATRPDAQPTGGGPALLDAACGYWARRGLSAEPDRVAAAPGAPALLLALTAAIGGDVLVPRPCAAWWAPQVRALGRSVFHVGTPAECGGVPDPYAFLETVRRVRAEGGDPRLLVLSVADDPTATVAPPELLHETAEAAAAEGLHLVSDETWRDTLHRPHDTVLLSPAEMLPDQVTVVTDLCGALLPPGWPAALARFPANAEGDALRARVLDVLTALDARIAEPVAAAAAYALGEPDPVTERLTAAVRLHARGRRRAPRGDRRGLSGPAPARAAICTSIWAPCGPPSAPTVSGTPRSWRTSSPPGSGYPHRAVTSSRTTSRRCASGWQRGRCSATRPGNGRSRSDHPNHWNCHTCDAR